MTGGSREESWGRESPLSFLEELPELCEICVEQLAVFDGVCADCAIEDGPDPELCYEEYL